ncbi:M23 family metallopeptidase [Mesorhizobium sp. YC-39]|uniref:M23 family metallopeptidase n=1 Tax=unclassified Mesorhizobium TaxID=325217 RepID=UPI0021E928D8|nr:MULTISPECIES: M23 family metallopeptidase [unclassified Mesorhizobium]MCV3205386.1 M23 family metallopeptidase [Mesorhizobium sp. YC-2]MCV3228215.1 M23 family metallopeptidase [Mesorhizobium sp. YC-39]
MLRLAILAVLAIGFATTGSAQSLKEGEVLSSLSVMPISEPNPVLGADGNVHLAYELLVVNTSRLFMTIDKVEVLDPAANVLWSADKDKLAGMTSMFSGASEKLSPGGSAAILVDAIVAKENAPPDQVVARLTVSREISGPDGKPAPFPSTEPLPATVTFTGASTPVGKPARIVQPPLRGTGWLAVNGCCDELTSHRGAIMAVNGLLRVPERFAIDWVKLDATDHVFTGDPSKLTSYAYYGAEIHAVADGVVVNLYDGAEEQIPGKIEGITTENIGGNMMVVDIGDGVFSFYAHMQRGSLRFKLGDRVKVGDVVGLLGNTGNTTAPHLHFHLMDGPSPLDANGLPFVFTRFQSRGVVVMSGDNDPLERGAPAVISDDGHRGQHENELPLNNQVIDFE